jgi:hypothetical protein
MVTSSAPDRLLHSKLAHVVSECRNNNIFASSTYAMQRCSVEKKDAVARVPPFSYQTVSMQPITRWIWTPLNPPRF